MSETVKVKKENLMNAYEKGNSEIKDTLVRLFPGHIIPISIHERIANGETISFEDILADQKILPEDFAKRIALDTPDEVAFKRAKLISLAINKTPLIDSEYWYVPYFTKSGFVFSDSFFENWAAYSFVGSRLCGFRKREDAIYAGKTFEQIYKPLL